MSESAGPCEAPLTQGLLVPAMARRHKAVDEVMLTAAAQLDKDGGRPVLPLQDAALRYHAMGCVVFPISDKVSALHRWKHLQDPENRPDEGIIRGWFRPPAEHALDGGKVINGIGVICGRVSGGLCVRDFDETAAYYAWADRFPTLAKTLPTCRTGRGFHVWHRGRAVHRRFGDGEYIGTSGQYVAAPDSWHPHARRLYEWVRPLPALDEPLPEVDPVEAGLLPGSGPSEAGHGGRRLPRKSHGFPNQCVTPPLQSVVRGCLPCGAGERHHCLLALVRRMDAARLGEGHLEPVFDLWWGFAEPVVRTKERRVSWREFVDAWKRSQERRSSGLAAGCLAVVMDLAEAMPVPLPLQHPDVLRRLYQLHAAMQQVAGSKPHFLSCHLGAELLGDVSHQTVWRWQQRLREAGILARTYVGERKPGGRASEWLFLGFQEQAGDLACAR